MAIRLREIDGTMIALCAVESNSSEGDIYLDDNVHYALATKFQQDYNLGGDSELLELMDREKVRDAKVEITTWMTSNK